MPTFHFHSLKFSFCTFCPRTRPSTFMHASVPFTFSHEVVWSSCYGGVERAVAITSAANGPHSAAVCATTGASDASSGKAYSWNIAEVTYPEMANLPSHRCGSVFLFVCRVASPTSVFSLLKLPEEVVIFLFFRFSVRSLRLQPWCCTVSQAVISICMLVGGHWLVFFPMDKAFSEFRVSENHCTLRWPLLSEVGKGGAVTLVDHQDAGKEKHRTRGVNPWVINYPQDS